MKYRVLCPVYIYSLYRAFFNKSLPFCVKLIFLWLGGLTVRYPTYDRMAAGSTSGPDAIEWSLHDGD